jgi:4-amino-4-deoxy-L-arabinose transferase-like glycosyltransferase
MTPSVVPRNKFQLLLSSPFAIVAVALAVRLVVMAFVYTNQLDPTQDHWFFGCEMGRVARSIVTGQGFSSPYTKPTGPSALLPPVYPFLLACVFKVFGVYSAASAVAILTLNNLFSAFTCLPIFLIARRVFNLRVAVWAGWIWAFFPYSIVLSNLWVWETALTTLLVTLLILATLNIEQSKRFIAWAGYGLLWSLAALTNPAVLSTLPFLGIWVWIRQWRRGINATRTATVAALVFLAALAPWVWRCSELYGRFVALRSNFGLEIMVGNSGDTSNPFNWSVLPAAGTLSNAAELDEVIRVGEPAYLAQKDREAKELIARRPLWYAEMSVRRLVYTWTTFWNFAPRSWTDDSGLPNVIMYSFISLMAWIGLVRSIRDGRDGAVVLAIPLICFPLVYYLTHPEIRFREPIDPVIVILAVFGAMSLFGRERTSRDKATHSGGVEDSTIKRA